MSLVSDLKEDLNFTSTLKTLTNLFTEISSIKVKKIREAFEKNTLFYEEILVLYHSVMESETRRRQALFERKASKIENPRTLYVAVTSNLRFYSDLNFNIIKKTVGDFDNDGKRGELIVIGQTGVDYLESSGKNWAFRPLRFKKDFPSPEESREFLRTIRDSERVLIYFPRFFSLSTQKVSILDIGKPLSAQTPSLKERISLEYLFEPELPKMVEFFENEVRFVLFSRTMLETNLSRTAARLVTMNKAYQKASSLVREKKSRLIKAEQSTKNNRLLETFAGRSRWLNPI